MTALKYVVAERFKKSKVDVVFAISVAELKSKTAEDCHFITVPTLSAKVSVPEFVVPQNEVLPETVPPALEALIIISLPLSVLKVSGFVFKTLTL